MNAKGVPTNLFELAVLATMAATYSPGLVARLMPFLSFVASTRRAARVRDQLLARYAPPPRLLAS